MTDLVEKNKRMNMRDTWSTTDCHVQSAYLVNRIANCLLEDDLFLPEDYIREIFVKDFPPLFRSK